MTGKASFTPEEWTLILEGPPSAGLIVVTAQRGGSFRETIAMAKAYIEARKLHGESELLDEIVAAKPEHDHTRYHSAEELKQAGLGPLIGKRTWGGVVGISGRGPLLDGGTVFVPEFATASAKGEYVIEGHGVDPDIVVENDAASVIDGKDPQLERGIAEVLKGMEANPKKLPGRPADPVKTPKH